MSFIDVLIYPESLPFTFSLALFFIISLVEVGLVWLGHGADFGLDLSLDVDAPNLPDSGGWVLDWLGLGRVPYLISFAGFLLFFGMLGLVVQDIQLEATGSAAPWPWVAMGCFFLSLPFVRFVNLAVGRIWPRDVDSSAVTADSLIGLGAVVVMGTVKAQDEGQIKFRDFAGTTHYGLATSENPADTFIVGDHVLIVARQGPKFRVIRHPNPLPLGEG